MDRKVSPHPGSPTAPPAAGRAAAPPDQSGAPELLTVYTNEYGLLNQEIFARFDSQRQAFSYLVTVAAILVTIILAVIKDRLDLDPNLILFVPLLMAPLGFIFFDSEIAIWAINRYIATRLRPAAAGLIAPEAAPAVSFWGDPRASLLPLSRWGYSALSLGRWVLFLLPLLLPLGYAAARFEAWWASPTERSTPWLSAPIVWPRRS